MDKHYAINLLELCLGLGTEFIYDFLFTFDLFLMVSMQQLGHGKEKRQEV